MYSEDSDNDYVSPYLHGLQEFVLPYVHIQRIVFHTYVVKYLVPQKQPLVLRQCHRV